MAQHQLSGGSLLKMCQGAQGIGQPIFQLLQTKKIAATSSERYRMLISDGVNSNSYGMLATQLNGYFHENKLEEFCIFKVKNFQCNNMQGKRVIIILDLEILQAGPKVGSKIGSPIAMAADGTVPLQSIHPNGYSDQNRAPNNQSNNQRFAQNQAPGGPPSLRSEIANNHAMDLDDSIEEIDFKAEFKDQLKIYDSKIFDSVENINAARENLIKWVEDILEEKEKRISNLTMKFQSARLLQSKYKPLEDSSSSHNPGEGSWISSVNSKKAMVESQSDQVNRLEKEVKQMKEKISSTEKESISLRSQLESRQLVLQMQFAEASSAKAQTGRLNNKLKFQEDQNKSLTFEITNMAKGHQDRIKSIETKLMKQNSLLKDIEFELNQINLFGNYISSKINDAKEMIRENSNSTANNSYGNLTINSMSSAMEEIINPAALKMEELKVLIQKSLQMIKDN